MNSELITAQQAVAMDAVEHELKLFELAQRKAAIYSKSTLVPKEYQGNVGNVLIAQNMAERMGADTLMVMQNLYVVHGRPGWSAQFLIATFNSNGRFSAIKYRFSGKEGAEDWGCVAYATELATGEEIDGTKITMGMAKKEGWSTKSGSKWLTMPEQMLRYRAAAFLIRATAPEIGMGLMTKEELHDMAVEVQPQSARKQMVYTPDPIEQSFADDLAKATTVEQVEQLLALTLPSANESVAATIQAMAKYKIERFEK